MRHADICQDGDADVLFQTVVSNHSVAPVAQWIRAADYGSAGCRFESCLAHKQSAVRRGFFVFLARSSCHALRTVSFALSLLPHALRASTRALPPQPRPSLAPSLFRPHHSARTINPFILTPSPIYPQQPLPQARLDIPRRTWDCVQHSQRIPAKSWPLPQVRRIKPCRTWDYARHSRRIFAK